MITDSIGNLIDLAEVERVTSLVPSWTDFIIRLNQSRKLVGITDYCPEPKSMQSLPRVGGTKNPNIDNIRQLKPDLVIANREENKSYDINLLKATNIQCFVSSAISVEDCLYEMKLLELILTGQITYSSDIEIPQTPKRSSTFLYFIWNEPMMVAGKGTYIDSVISTAGGINLVEDARYPKITKAQLVNCQPDFVFLPNEPYEFSELELLEYQELFPNSEVLLVDGKLASWYGFRVVEGVNYFRSCFLE